MGRLGACAVAAVGICAIFSVTTKTAQADSLIAKQDETPTVNWTGLYAGAGAGYGSLTGDRYVNVLDWSEDYSKVDREAGYFTATIGYDFQFADRFVLGGFAEYDASNASDAELTQYSIGGRLGYLLTKGTLLFVSAGYSKMDIADQSLADVGYPELAKWCSDKVGLPTATGVFFGGGVETMLTEHVTLRGEYRHAVFDQQTVDLPEFQSLLLNFDLDRVATAKFKPESDIFRLTLNYRF